jgi:hypothetical protein
MATATFLNEVTLYGAVSMTRADVYAACLADTGDKRAADRFAFGGRAVADEPFTLAEFRALEAEAHREAA